MWCVSIGNLGPGVGVVFVQRPDARLESARVRPIGYMSRSTPFERERWRARGLSPASGRRRAIGLRSREISLAFCCGALEDLELTAVDRGELALLSVVADGAVAQRPVDGDGVAGFDVARGLGGLAPQRDAVPVLAVLAVDDGGRRDAQERHGGAAVEGSGLRVLADDADDPRLVLRQLRVGTPVGALDVQLGGAVLDAILLVAVDAQGSREREGVPLLEVA